MNRKICEKCNYKTDLYIVGSVSDEGVHFLGLSLEKKIGCFCELYLKSSEGFTEKDLHSIISDKFIDKITENKIEPTKLCPYYAEHQLNDWSKKNE